MNLTGVNVTACIGGYYWSIILEEDIKTNTAGCVHVFVNYKSSDKPLAGGSSTCAGHTWMTSFHVFLFLGVNLTLDYFLISQSDSSSVEVLVVLIVL